MDLRYQPANPTPQAQVQNHIKGVHACAMALLAESATGAVFGMNVPGKRERQEREERRHSPSPPHTTLSLALGDTKVYEP